MAVGGKGTDYKIDPASKTTIDMPAPTTNWPAC